MEKPTLTTKQIKARLDQLLKVVRYNLDSPTEGICETCRTKHAIKELQAGHFIKRSDLWLKYDPRNLMAQCIRCNHFMDGCQDKAAYVVIKKYGLDTFNQMVELDYKWLAQEKKPGLKKNELIHHYNYWLRKNREVEQKLNIKLIPNNWSFL